MSPKTETLLLCSLWFALVGGLLVFTCVRDARALRTPTPIAAPLHP